MIEIIKETLNELKSIKIDIQDDKEKIDNSIKNLEFIVKEYKRLIDQGVRFIRKPEIEKWGGKVATFEDPDKNRINLIEQKK